MDSIAVQAAQLAMKTASRGNDSRRTDNASAMQAVRSGNASTDRFVRSVSHRQAERTEQTKQDKLAERAKQDKAAEKQINEVRSLIEQGVGIDGMTLKRDSENRLAVTYQFDVDDPAFQSGDMGIRTITHSRIKNWKNLVDKKLAPKNFKRGKIKSVITETLHHNRNFPSGTPEYTFLERVDYMWRPPSSSEAG